MSHRRVYPEHNKYATLHRKNDFQISHRKVESLSMMSESQDPFTILIQYLYILPTLENSIY